MAGEQADELAAALAPRLALLRALATEQHLTRVADQLGVPQPTVSRWLAAISEQLGAPVVVRSGRGIRLTRAGELLAEAAAGSLGALTAGCRRAVQEAHPERGQVVLGFLHMLGRSLVPELVRGFRARHPGVRFGLVQAARQEVLARLAAGRVDLAFVAPLPVDQPEFGYRRVSEQELLVNMPESHRFAGRRRVRLAELADEEFIGMEHGTGLRQITDELCADAGFTPRMAFEGQETETVRALVAAGLGVALLPPAETGPPPGVVELPVTPRASRTIGLVWVADQPVAPAVAAFREFTLMK
ncbi:LysR family transcriptional regulator [Goodfellowiella coeruleoviolacea]|uniref:DNA-binding transcriptional regulator, LysR family n=1 Tax=Goodfellowiella coeruleoviolacea TaxID=334858 RepID=A0AAE3GCJ1_9PSEU|nr:LysR family transcriptional regulator [Goodfellowiella coeruleoviolacea]MCP2165595.1 DNA-binding transcriptional regulator, LysR family [Goodfellowiella coeruleoviolacea]